MNRAHPFIDRVRHAFAHRDRRRERSAAADERLGLSMLGYSLGSRRAIDVAPLDPPVPETEARPRGLPAISGAHYEQRFEDAESIG